MDLGSAFPSLLNTEVPCLLMIESTWRENGENYQRAYRLSQITSLTQLVLERVLHRWPVSYLRRPSNSPLS